MTDLRQAEPVAANRVIECATRLVEHADFKLGGILNADSKAKDIPSNAVSSVKARHLAALRDAIAGTPPQQQAEPVAWVFAPNNELLWPREVEVTNPIEIDSYYPLYTAPPQRQWVGLTDEDFCDQDQEWIAGASWAEAKLKERNND
jgi:hypothetical protein